MTSHFIKNATVISMDPKIGIKENCDVVIKDGIIKDVGPNLKAEDGMNTIDGSHAIVSPGFVDTHHHLWQNLIRTLTTDWSLADYAVHIRNIYASAYTAEDVYTANYSAALDCINNGITTTLDHSHILNSPQHTDASIKGMKDAGIRGTWCYAFYESPDRQDLEEHCKEHDASKATPKGFDHKARVKDAKRARDEHFKSNDPEKDLLTFGGAPSEAEGMPPEDLREEIKYLREIGARVITMHIGMGCYDVGNNIVKMLGENNMLDKDLVFSHGAALTDEELKLLAKSGAAVSSTAETELQMGMGRPIAWKAAAAGANVGVGIDITSNQNNDILASLRLLLQAERGYVQLPMFGKEVPIVIKPTSLEALNFATLGGAKCMGLDHMIGSITPGKRADILITRCDAMNVVPVINPVGALMMNAHIGNIDTVMIEGKIRKQNYEVLDCDWPKLREDVRTRAARVVKVCRSGPIASTEEYWKEVFTKEHTH